jgi:small GTP-binding protein
MTSATTLQGPIAALREREIQLLNDIAQALQEEGEEAADDRRRLRDVAQDLHDMFFMVGVIGEFNSGKSTFVNALLGERLLPMGITPTTEYIELIRYNASPNKVPTVREDGLREWAHPNTGAEGVAIVDTPGTGSVFERHEKTAKEFLHRSDLVIFLISAKQAFAETERKYIEMAQRFGKKIILVVNQVDLLQQSERSEVRAFIEEQVRDKLGFEPLIFMVSAKEALTTAEAGNTNTAEPGGVDAVKAHLRGVYSSEPPARQKLLAQLATAEGCLQSFIDSAKKKSDLVSTDIGKVREVQAELEQQSLGLEAQMREAGNRIKTVLESVRKRGLDWIETNFSPRLLGRNTVREKMQADFQEVVIGRSLRDISESTNDYINAVIDQSRLYWRSVIDRLNQIQDLMDQEMSGLDANVYAEQRKTLQEAISIAEGELKTYSTGTVVAEMEQIFKANLSNFQGQALFTAGGLAVVALAILTPGPLIGGAMLAFPAFLVGAAVATVAGVPAYRTYRKMRKETKQKFNDRVDLLIKSYDESLSELTQKERNRLTQYGNQILTPIFSRLEVLSKRYAEQRERLERYMREIDDLRGRIEAL